MAEAHSGEAEHGRELGGARRGGMAEVLARVGGLLRGGAEVAAARALGVLFCKQQTSLLQEATNFI